MIEEYLGDGVYAVFDGYGITLDLRGEDDSTSIVLEPEIMEALIRFNNKATEYKYQRERT